ncbi:MAG: hypothetical protein DLM61_14690 [Pseudonocardiales bacterium]|nr:MAG: hypothetical protein DLM61_14690 [Pseudonocardiales bacterium]
MQVCAELVEGNTKLESTRAASQVGGPALGGGLVQLGGVANAVLIDALSYLISAVALARIRTVEPRPERRTPAAHRDGRGPALRAGTPATAAHRPVHRHR